jgi:hypothetical protein
MGLSVSNIGVLNERIFPSSGLTSYWRMDEGTGTAMADVKGVANGTATIAQWITGKNNSGFLFDGTHYANCGTNYLYAYTQPYSVSFWYKMTGSGSFGVICSNLDATTSGWLDMYFTLATGIFNWCHFKNNTTMRIQYSSTAGQIPVDTVWHNLVCTFNGTYTTTSKICYLDGNAITGASSLLGPSAGALGSTLQLGHRYPGAYDGINVDEIGFWNRVLTDNEAKKIYNLGTGIYY